MHRCSQCGRQAIYIIEGHYLCLFCYERFMNIQLQQMQQASQMMNYLSDRIDETMGIRSTARIEISRPVNAGNATYNHISVDRSVIGTINTGLITNLNQSMDKINNGTDPILAKNLANFINQVLQSKELNKKIKLEITEQISFLAEQIILPPPQRKSSLIKNVLVSLGKSINTVASLVTLWQVLSPTLLKYLAN